MTIQHFSDSLLVNSETLIMDFFDIGPLEILLIMVIALIIWGPAKIPEIARTLGKTINTLKKATSDLTTTVTRELSVQENQQPKSTTVPASENKKAPDSGAPESVSSEETKGETTGPSEQNG